MAVLAATAIAALGSTWLPAGHQPGPTGRAGDCGRRPYAATSPWNVPVPSNAVGRPTMALQGILTSDPTQYTYPVYEVTDRTPRASVRVRGYWSSVGGSGRSLRIFSGGAVRFPLPPNVAAARGSDAQVILVNRVTGDEWGVWQLESTPAGWSVQNGYHYNVHWSGVPPRTSSGRSFGSRGAGVPYLAGLVRPCEIARGRIDHALAFAYQSPSPAFVYPATKSDGRGRAGVDLPEGTRLALSLNDEQVRALGCTGPCLTIARALREYGMYVIDNSGRPKVMLEYEGTAHWDGLVSAGTVSPLPLADFQVVEAPARPRSRSSGAPPRS
jgi:hypothetical protein